MREKLRFLLMCTLIELAIIASIAVACSTHDLVFALFYNVGYGIVCSVFVPILLYWNMQRAPHQAAQIAKPLSADDAPKILEADSFLRAFGFYRLHARQFIVLTTFVVFSVGGQLFQHFAQGGTLETELLRIGFLPLLMTTFFEEFLFRGFIQTQSAKRFGAPIAVVFSGLCFALYHLGYPGFRTVPDILLLFAVGTGFALSFALAQNNFWVSFLVNLPNAYITYMLKQPQFPPFESKTSLYAVAAIATSIALLFACHRHEKTKC